MATNMMETLKQVQHDLADQKAYMRNLHVINTNLNEKLISMGEKISIMAEKISDLPQVLITIERLEQQVKKNNMLLFGNDETEKNVEDRALVPYRKDHEDKNIDHLVEPTEKCMEDTKATTLHNSSEVSPIEEAEKNSKETKHDNSFQRADQCKDEVRGLITNQIKEVKEMIRDFMKIRHDVTSVEETATCGMHDGGRIPQNYLNTDHINRLDDKLNDITNVYQSDMRKIKELIKESIAINKKSIEESSKPALKQETVKAPSISFSAEQISQLNTELKHITDATQSKIKEIKELIKNADAASKLSIQEATELFKQETILRESNQSAIMEIKEIIKDLAKNMPIKGTANANTVREPKIVKVSPTYFSADQLSKLNGELKRIAETYQETNIFPIVEVIPRAGDEHSVMKLLRRGVYFPSDEFIGDRGAYQVKLGCNGVHRSDIIDLITENPDLTLFEVVRECLIAIKVWDKARIFYTFSKPHIYDEYGQLQPYSDATLTRLN